MRLFLQKALQQVTRAESPPEIVALGNSASLGIVFIAYCLWIVLAIF